MMTMFPPQINVLFLKSWLETANSTLSVKPSNVYRTCSFHVAVLQSAPSKFTTETQAHSHCFAPLKFCLVTFSLPSWFLSGEGS